MMPIYEYRCLQCETRSTLLVLKPQEGRPTCSFCDSENLEKVMSRFAAPKSEEARLEALADPRKLGDLDENDPQSMARFMKKMGREMGEDFGDDVDAAMENPGKDEEESAMPE